MYFTHHTFADHSIEAYPVQEKRPDIERPVAVIGCRETGSDIYCDVAVFYRRDTYGCGQNRFYVYARVGHQGVADGRILFSASCKNSVRICTLCKRR